MPKKKKTRDQKMLADKRRAAASESLYTFTSTLPKSQEKHQVSVKQQAATISTASYKYLASDLRKTFLFTSLIIIAELVVYYVTRGV